MQKPSVYWACRRGMLELDTMLIPFVRDCFEGLTKTEQEDFVRFLEAPDLTIYGWLIQQNEPDDDAFKALVRKIQTHVKVHTAQKC